MKVRGLVWALWSSTLLSAAGAAAYMGSISATPHVRIGHDPHGFVLMELAIYLAFATVGAVVAYRRPLHPIGWMFLGAGLLLTLAELGHGYAHHAVLAGGGSLLGEWAVWISVVAFLPAFFTIVFALPLVFPDGTLLSPRWRIVLWTGALSIFSMTLAEALAPGPVSSFPEVSNPAGLTSAAPLVQIVLQVTYMLTPVLLLASIAAVVVRFKRSAGPTRQQFKWVAFFAGLLIVFVPLNEIALKGSGDALETVGNIMFVVAFGGLPVGVGFAVLRYRLYDIDRIISRTLAYALILAVLGALYAGLVVGLQQLTRPLIGGQDLIVAGSTLAVAAAFGPVRRRIRDIVDRRFNRARYDATHTIEAFSSQLRNELHLEGLQANLEDVAWRTMQPTHTFLWLPAKRVPPGHDARPSHRAET